MLQAELDKAAIGDRIINLKEIAEKIGVKIIKREQVMGIIQTFTCRHPDYKAVKMLSRETTIATLFNSITFIDKGLEFENVPPYGI